MKVTPFRITVTLLIVLAIAVIIAIVWAFRTNNDDRDTCHSLGGQWLTKYELCISNDAVIPMP